MIPFAPKIYQQQVLDSAEASSRPAMNCRLCRLPSPPHPTRTHPGNMLRSVSAVELMAKEMTKLPVRSGQEQTIGLD